MSKRAQKVGDLIREEIAVLLLRKIRDPRLEGVSITGIDMTNDLRLARIYIRMFDSGDKQLKALKALKKASGFIKYEMGRTLNLRYIPELQFIIDPSLEYSKRIEKILDDIKHN